MAENFFGLTDTGKIRTNNEDTFIAQKVMNNRYVLGCVIDGVGGYNGGEVAAAIAHDEIVAVLQHTDDEVIPAMISAFKLANRRIIEKKAQDSLNDSMACVSTMALADVANNLFYYAHVGDTRLYLLRDNSLVKISKDHSFVGFLEDTGRLTETAAMQHPKRNEINKALGFDIQMDTDDTYIETGQSPFLPGDMLLLCSDGLTDMVDKTEITDIITQPTSLQQKAKSLITAANNNGGNDNITVVLVQNDKAPQVITATKPASTTKLPGENGKGDTTVRELKATGTQVQPSAKKGSFFTKFFAVLALIFLIAAVGFYFQWKNSEVPEKPIAAVVKPGRNAQELKLQKAIDSLKGDTLVLSAADYKSPVILSDALRIQKDSLYIKGNGVLITKDTTYNGPALSLSARCRLTLLDSLQFKDFKTTVLMVNSTLVLKHVQFGNSPFPVQRAYVLPNGKYISTQLPANTIKVDTLIKKTSAANGAK
ncbi:hypothetical protein GCM10023149_05090 [Mucilaginibacter gynuensis]|uniref:PPM-type phosphatase domain-containing protein n=1 Tax=Mucilaginibacter gynuensis TaxID=1302236 RepID=A0ABP8FT55_9SPHI